MQLSTQALTDFKLIYLKRFGVQLSNQEANEKGVELLRFMKLIYRPIPKQELEAFLRSKEPIT